ncbi:MAG: hypothetical protein ACE5DN_02490 [Flavobacteriales bacterium]
MTLIVDCGSSKVPDIVRAVKACGHSPVITGKNTLTNAQLSNARAIIISGNPLLIRDSGKESIIRDFSYIKHCEQALLGICFGHQAISLVYGGQVCDGKEDRGRRKLEILEENPLFKGICNMPEFEEDHCETASLPDNFSLLAHSTACANEAMKHKYRDIFGVQFHPELSENGWILIRNFLALC